jgi:hypothetical protein
MTKWVFANKDHTAIRRVEDGSTFEWHRREHLSNIHGHAAERWRHEGCPWPNPYKTEAPKVRPATPAPKTKTIVDDQARARRRAGE